MDKLIKFVEKRIGLVCVVGGLFIIAVPFIWGISPNDPTKGGVHLLFGLLLMCMGCLMSTIYHLQKERELLDTPIKHKVLLRLRDENRHCLATVYVNRRTEVMFAPLDDDPELVLEWVDLCNISHMVLRAPYFSEDRKTGTVFMLCKHYKIPPK